MANSIVKIQSIKKNLSIVLKAKRAEKGYRTVLEFVNAIKAYFDSVQLNVGESTINAWYFGKTVPEADNLNALCDFLDCDIDHLFGRREATTYDREFICRETGLSESAVIKLQESNRKRIRPLFDEHLQFQPLQLAINALLESDDGIRILHSIYDYLYATSFDLLNADDEAISPPQKLRSISNGHTFDFSSDNFSSILLLDIQSSLAVMRSKKNKSAR